MKRIHRRPYWRSAWWGYYFGMGDRTLMYPGDGRRRIRWCYRIWEATRYDGAEERK